METNNQKKQFNGLPFYALTFLVALLFEFYWILNGPADYFMLIGIGIIIVITGYLTIDNIMKAREEDLAARQQQNETMIKAQKAIYLATKKNVMETEKTREQSMKTLEVLMAGMVSSQKELVNVITTKSDEFAAKQIAMNDSSADISELVDKLSKSNEKLAKQVQDAVTINELVKANAELVKSVQGMFGGTMPQAAATPTEEFTSIPVENIAPTINLDPIMTEAENMEAIPEDDIEDISPAFEDLGIAESVIDDTIAETTEEFTSDAEVVNEEIINDINAAQMEEAQTLEDMTVVEDISPELDEEMSATADIEATVAESAEFAEEADSATVDDERDPNAPLSEEEIAALFASL